MIFEKKILNHVIRKDISNTNVLRLIMYRCMSLDKNVFHIFSILTTTTTKRMRQVFYTQVCSAAYGEHVVHSFCENHIFSKYTGTLDVLRYSVKLSKERERERAGY